MNSDEPPTPAPYSGMPSDPGGGASPETEGATADCERVVGALGFYLTHELTIQERMSLDSHFSDCPACRRAAEEYAEVIRLARSLPPPALPPGVEQRLREMITHATRTPDREPDCSLDETVVGPLW